MNVPPETDRAGTEQEELTQPLEVGLQIDCGRILLGFNKPIRGLSLSAIEARALAGRLHGLVRQMEKRR